MKTYKNGITFMSVVIIIVIMVLITATLVMTSFNMLSTLYLKKFGNEMVQVQHAVDSYVMRNSGVIDFEKVELETLNFNEYQEAQYLSRKPYPDEVIELYEVDLSKIDAENTSYGNKKDGDKTDRYLYSKKTQNIYYEKGFEDSSGNIYYTITNNLKEILK